MPITLQEPRVAEVLDRMYTESREQMPQLRERRPDMSPERTVEERADAMSDFYIPVTPEAGRLLYSLVRATRPETIVELCPLAFQPCTWPQRSATTAPAGW
jgi:predicted O-methyltransferase YrrM